MNKKWKDIKEHKPKPENGKIYRYKKIISDNCYKIGTFSYNKNALRFEAVEFCSISSFQQFTKNNFFWL